MELKKNRRMPEMNRCAVPKCKKNGDYITWLGHNICEIHFNRHCNELHRFNLYKALGITKEVATEAMVTKT